MTISTIEGPMPQAERGASAVSWHALVNATKRLMATIRHGREVHRSVDQLSELDDRMLGDIGLTREDVASAIRYGRLPQR